MAKAIFEEPKNDFFSVRGSKYYIKPFYLVTNCLGLAPPYNFNTPQTQKFKRAYRYYATLVSFVILATYSYGVFGVTTKIYGTSQTTTIVIQMMYHVFITGFNTISIITSGFQHYNAWVSMLNIYVKLDTQMSWNEARKVSRSFFTTQILLGHIFLAIVLVYDGYVGQIYFGGHLYKFYFCFRLQYYFILANVVLMCYFASEIKLKFQYFNGMLRKVVFNDSGVYIVRKHRNSVSPMAHGKNLNASGSLKQVTRMFAVLGEFVEMYNKIFGWQILILMGIVLMALLESFNFIMVYGITVKEQYGKDSPFDMIAQSLATTFVFLLWGILVIIYCDLANKEIQKSATISFQMLPEMSAASHEVKKLLFLAQQAANRCPQLTAANVFDVNISTLFALFGSITTYVVVVIQFNTM